jgi:hypothetical protein
MGEERECEAAECLTGLDVQEDMPVIILNLCCTEAGVARPKVSEDISSDFWHRTAEVPG